jgi:hypothetical protein
VSRKARFSQHRQAILETNPNFVGDSTKTPNSTTATDLQILRRPFPKVSDPMTVFFSPQSCSQKLYFSANWINLGFTAELVIWPNAADAAFVTGFENCG